MPQWFVSFEPSTRARTFMGSVKKNVSYTKLLHCLRNDSYRKPSGKTVKQDKPIIIVPRLASLMEHRNDHQIATAMRMDELG